MKLFRERIRFRIAVQPVRSRSPLLRAGRERVQRQGPGGDQRLPEQDVQGAENVFFKISICENAELRVRL